MDEARMQEALRRACAGEAAAFADLYRQFSARVFGLCRHLLGSAEAAEDATSEVFLRAQRAMSSYDHTLPFPPWLLSIASHYCLDRLRRRRLERRLFEAPEANLEVEKAEASNLSPLGELLESEQWTAVRAALAALPECYRVTLALRYNSELSYDQIAAALGLKRNHVATLIFRAKKELRRVLDAGTREPGAHRRGDTETRGHGDAKRDMPHSRSDTRNPIPETRNLRSLKDPTGKGWS